MNRMLGVALAAGLAFLPTSSYAVDKALGVVQSADPFTGILVIRADGEKARDMTISVSEKVNFYELYLYPGDRVSFVYDRTGCGDDASRLPTARKVAPVS